MWRRVVPQSFRCHEAYHVRWFDPRKGELLEGQPLVGILPSVLSTPLEGGVVDEHLPDRVLLPTAAHREMYSNSFSCAHPPPQRRIGEAIAMALQ